MEGFSCEPSSRFAVSLSDNLTFVDEILSAVHSPPSPSSGHDAAVADQSVLDMVESFFAPQDLQDAVPVLHSMDDHEEHAAPPSAVSAELLVQPSRKRRAVLEDAGCAGELAVPKRKKNRREQDIIATLRHLHAERMLLDLQFTGSKLARIEFDPKWHKRAIDELNKHVICKKNDLQSSSAGVPRHNLREFFRYAKVLPQSRRGTRHRDWENSCVWEIVDAAPVHYAAALQRGVQPLC
eukprot:CAMPEP_0181336656 /NCGR_PEP_ID=MMETSP1101-20121128/27547_1 /TAXON_ID=46948 /ORGANISM="Rhodomonas abbreviata, Strain Caron Lab Isolate" /LENGTH=237 /DNA_ID=CAMNT_0023446989 /DNA_START=181 /DNA_END=894 /DNA_ORIENTATION=+